MAVSKAEHRRIARFKVHDGVKQHVPLFTEGNHVHCSLNNAVIKGIADRLGNRVDDTVQHGLDNMLKGPVEHPFPAAGGIPRGIRTRRIRRNSRISSHGRSSRIRRGNLPRISGCSIRSMHRTGKQE